MGFDAVTRLRSNDIGGIDYNLKKNHKKTRMKEDIGNVTRIKLQYLR